MISFFAAYEVLSRSGLFDPAFYQGADPEGLNGADPLSHYIEFGAAEGRDPNPAFDTAFYLEQCAAAGIKPEIPLLHYIEEGAALGLAPRRPLSPIDRIAIDTLAITEGEDGGNGVRGAGWLIASGPVREIAIEHGGALLGIVAYGVDRPDLKDAFGDLAGDGQHGFTFHVDRLPDAAAAELTLEFVARLDNGETVRQPLDVKLPEAPDPLTRKWSRGGLDSLGIPPMRLQVDDCKVDAQGLLTITGWAVCLVPIVKIELFADDEALGPAEFGMKREDVEATYPDYHNGAFSGLRFVTDTRLLGEGRRTIRVRCTAKGGLRREVIIPMLIAKPEKPLRTTDRAQVRLECDDFALSEDGKVKVNGWAFCAAGIDTLTVLLDELPVGQAQIGIDRADVGNQFPEHPEARRSGYRFEAVVAGGGIEGEHVLCLRVVTNEGGVGEMRLPVMAVPVEGQAPVGGDENGIRVSIDAPAILSGAATSTVTSSLSINGWSLAEAGVAAVDIALDDQRITTAYYGIRRDDVAAAFPDRKDALLCGFAAVIPPRALARGPHKIGIWVRDKAGNAAPPLEFTIEVGQIAEEVGPWTLRTKLSQSEINLFQQQQLATGWEPAFNLILPVGSTDKDLAAARTTLNSLSGQPYDAWTVSIVPATAATDMKRVKRDLSAGLDEIAGKVGFGKGSPEKRRLDQLVTAPAGKRGELIGLIRAGDELGIDAFFECASWTARHRDADFVYGDERRMNPGTGEQDAFFKPDWSPDLLLSTNYIGRPWFATRALLERTGTTFEDLTAKGDYDLVLRLTENAAKVGHVPVLMMERGGGKTNEAKLEKAALESALARRGIKATVAKGAAPGFFHVRRAYKGKGLVSIIIPTRAAGGLVKTCLDTIRETSTYRNFEIVCIENIPEKDAEWRDWLLENADKVVSTTEPFNWSRFNNLAAEKAEGEFLVFLNDDIEIISPDWLDVLLGFAQRPETGIVGPLLLYPDRGIQHAGIFLTSNGTARHAFRHGPEDDPGYFGLALTDRNVIGVTGACLMTRRDVFDEIGRFDEAHTVVNNDVDYCLRAWQAGYLNVYTAQMKLIHHELASRSEISDDYDSVNFDKRWGETFLRGDPYFHPRLSKNFDDFVIDREPFRVVCPGRPLLSPDRIRRLLINKLDHIGDAVTAIPAIKRLRAFFPNARVSVMAGRSTKSVWSFVPGIDEVIEFDFFHARSGLGQTALSEDDLEALRARLAPYRFDLAVDLRKSPDTRHILKYTNARYLAGFGHQTDFPWLDITLEWEGDPRFLVKHAHVSDDLIRLVQAIELACSDDRTVVSSPKVMDRLPEFLPADFGERRIVAVHPAAGTPTRQWPAHYFAQLIDLLVEDYDVNVAIIGGPDEIEIADTILADVRHSDRVVSCLGKMKLQETSEFLPKCALFVGNNSGPSHIAAALGVPTVAVHSGVIASEEWAPYGPTGVAIRRDMTCAPCYIAQPEDCPRSLACLGRLSAGEVLEVCSRFLATT
jgi:ADP-heptose:LPS heptosyltransferase/GT2 family glycosyltransferase